MLWWNQVIKQLGMGAVLAVLIPGALLAAVACTPVDAFGGGSSTTPQAHATAGMSASAFCGRFSPSDLSQITGYSYTSFRAVAQMYASPLPTWDFGCGFASSTSLPDPQSVLANQISLLVESYPDVNSAAQRYTSDKQKPKANGLDGDGCIEPATDLSGLADQAFVVMTCDGWYEHAEFRKGAEIVAVGDLSPTPAVEQVAKYILSKLP